MSVIDMVLIGWAASASGFTLVALSRLITRRRDPARAAIPRASNRVPDLLRRAILSLRRAGSLLRSSLGQPARLRCSSLARPPRFGLARLATVGQPVRCSGVRWPPVLLLRPVDEPTDHERSLWGSPIDYPGALEQVVVSPLRHPLPDGVAWLRSTPTSPNRKVGHLAFAVATLPIEGRVVMSVDADVQVDGALVRGLVEAVLAGAAVASAPPEPVGSGLGAALWRGLLVHSHLSFASLGVMQAGAPALCREGVGVGPARAA